VADVVAIKIKADAKQAKREIKGLGRGFTDLASGAKKASADLFVVTAAVAALGAAVVATGVAIVKNAAAVAELGDETAKTARIVGVSAEQFQVLKFAANRSGVAMGAVTAGMKKLARSMFDAQRGSKQIKETFEGMGISIEDGNGELRDSFDVLKDLADRMQRVGVNSRTTAEAMVVLGRSGADLTNLLITGSAGLADYEDQAKSLGGIMDGHLLAASEAYQDSIADLDLATQGLKNELATGLIPTLTVLADVMANRVIPNTRRMIQAIGEFKLPAGLKTILRTLPGGGLVDIFGAGATVAGGLAAGPDVPDLPARTTPFINLPGPGANGPPGGGKVEPTEENFPAPFALAEAVQIAQDMQTEATVAGIAARLFWERDALATTKALKDAAEAEDIARQERAIQRAQDLANAQAQAASSAFSAVETFAGIAQGAVEDSYFGQTKAGRTAAKALFIAGKAAALASAIVNTAQAISASAAIGYPAAIPGVAAAGITGGAAIGTIVGTTIQGLADAGLAPGALRDAGLHGHTAIAISPGEAVIDPVGTAEISRMLALQRRQMEMAAQGGANGGPVVVVAELDGRRVSRGLSGPMTADLEDGHDYRRNVRMGVA